MISLRGLSLAYGPQVIFDAIDADIGARDRIALAGPNGAGKSTLLKILAGQSDYDGGSVERARHTTVGYLPQDGLEAHGRTLVAEVESAFTQVIELQASIADASARMQQLDATDPEYLELVTLIGDWEHRLEHHEPARIPARIRRVLHGLGFSDADMERPCEHFSGGWQMRIALAKLLLGEPSVLLLDEPTNHLDIETQAWLEDWLRRYEGSIVLVSHDRAFLDSLCTRTFALSRGHLECYSGNFTECENAMRERREQLIKAAELQEKSLAKTQEFIDRFRYKATKASQVQSRIKAMDKIERIEIEEEESSIGFSFPPPPPSGRTVLEIEGLCKSYGNKRVLAGVDLTVERGDRIAIVGHNGAGKSTLVRMLSGSEPPTAGAITPGHQVSNAYFAQHQALELDPALDVLETASELAAFEVKPKVRTLLGAFLFRGDAVFKKVSVLSGGERNRLALARLLLTPFNCLILDEPTNHLDIRSKAVLQEALRNFGGTLLIVSHDRDFLDSVVTKVWEVRDGRVFVHPGNVSDYLAATAARRQAAWSADDDASAAARKPSASDTSTGATPEDAAGGRMDAKERRRHNAAVQSRLSPLKKKLESTEKEIARLETAIKSVEDAMLDPAFYKQPDAVARVQAYDRDKTALDETFMQWSETGDAIAAIEKELL